MKKIGENTTKSLQLFQDAAARLVKVGNTEPALKGVGSGILDSLASAVAIAIKETQEEIGKTGARRLQQLESKLTEFRAVEDLETAVRWQGDSKEETIDVIKGVLKKLKHLLPIPKEWVLIIDE